MLSNVWKRLCILYLNAILCYCASLKKKPESHHHQRKIQESLTVIISYIQIQWFAFKRGGGKYFMVHTIICEMGFPDNEFLWVIFLYQPTTTKHSTVHDVLAFFWGVHSSALPYHNFCCCCNSPISFKSSTHRSFYSIFSLYIGRKKEKKWRGRGPP